MALINNQDLKIQLHLNLDIPQESLNIACNILGLYLSQNNNKTLIAQKDINGEVKVYIDTIQSNPYNR